jgi:1,4-dihydroxy-2-naphthoyl-CoA hydrolase
VEIDDRAAGAQVVDAEDECRLAVEWSLGAGGRYTARSEVCTMSIWFREFTLEEIRRIEHGTMVEHLGIEFTQVGPDFVAARMPVDRRTVQPDRILHGGASVALAETLGSVGGTMCVDRERFQIVGQEINANHLRPAMQGYVHGRASPIHLGRRSQVWSIEIRDDNGRLICISRLTIAVVDRQPR